MKRLLALYPRRWRERYGAELEAFLASEPMSLSLVVDLVRGIVSAYLRPDLQIPRLATAGAGGAVAFRHEVGFRHVGARLAAPFSLKRDRRTLTIQEVICTPDTVDLVYEFITPPTEITPRSQVPKPEAVTLREGRTKHRTEWIRGSSGNASTTEAGKVVRTLLLHPDPPLPTDMRTLELHLEGAAFGEWIIPIQLVPFPSGADAPAPRVDASDSHEGITLTVRNVALTEDTTAIELQVSAEAGRIHGIGGFTGLRGGTTALTLRDQTGRSYAEHARGRPRDQFPGSRHSGTVAVFDRLYADALELELEVPFVCVDETKHEVDVDLPVTTPIDVSLGPYPIRMLASRQVQSSDPSEPGVALAVDFDLGGWHGDRRILTFSGPLKVDGEYRGGGFRGATMTPAEPEPMNYAEIPLEDPLAARRLTLSGPTVQVRGPWRIRFTQPSSAEPT